VTLTSFGLVLAKAHNDVLWLLRLSGKVILEDRPGTSRVASLRIERSARVVRNHSISSTERVLHGAPGVIPRCGLHVPHITRVSVQLSALDGRSDRILVANGTTSSVNEPSALLEVLEQFSVNESAGSLVQRAVDCDDVALGYHFLEVLHSACIYSLGGGGRERRVIVVEKLFAVEWFETLKDTVADAACTNGADNLALKIVSVPCDVRNLPVSALDHLKSMVFSVDS
jgi:hypothetical protein